MLYAVVLRLIALGFACSHAHGDAITAGDTHERTFEAVSLT